MRRKGRGAKKAPYALFQAVFVAVQHVKPAVAWLKMERVMRIILSKGLQEHISKSHTESLGERAERLGHFTDDVRHVRSLTNEPRPGKLQRQACTHSVKLTEGLRRCQSDPCKSALHYRTTPIPFGRFWSPPFALGRPTPCPERRPARKRSPIGSLPSTKSSSHKQIPRFSALISCSPTSKAAARTSPTVATSRLLGPPAGAWLAPCARIRWSAPANAASRPCSLILWSAPTTAPSRCGAASDSKLSAGFPARSIIPPQVSSMLS